MPELGAAKRGSGSWIRQGIEPGSTRQLRRHYGAADAGSVCSSCGTPMVAALEAVEPFGTHPSCDETDLDLRFTPRTAAQAARHAVNSASGGEPGT